MPRQKGQYSLAANQMQLAMALSSSLEESNKRELSNLTEELPASNIESGLVPQNIKQMQKDFLEQLQMPRPGPSKKSKKPPKSVPTLTIRSADERLRIITEKVALVLIKEDTSSCTLDNDYNPKMLQEVDEKESVLWSISGMSPSKTDRNSYYISSLNTFVSPSKVAIGSKVNTVFVPRRLKTPVKLGSGKDFHTNKDLLSSPNDQLDTSFKQRSTPDQRELETTSVEYQAQLDLQNDWQRMLHNSSLNDITIIVKERVKMWAHKLVLAARCPAVIEDLDENVLHWETVPHVQARAFLEFIYCATLLPIRALGENVNGVILLAQKYKVTELLKFILASNVCSGASSRDDGDLLQLKSCQESRTSSPDLFADSEKLATSSEIQATTETFSEENHATSKQLLDKTQQLTEMPIEISSDEEENDLVKNFFGTYNPAVCSPPKHLSLSRSQSAPNRTESSTKDQSQTSLKSNLELPLKVTNESSPSHSNSSSDFSPHSKLRVQNLSQWGNVASSDGADRCVNNESGDDLFSPLKACEYQSPTLFESSSHICHSNMLASDKYIHIKDATKTEPSNSSRGSVEIIGSFKDDNSFSMIASSPHPKANIHSRTAVKHSRKSLFQTPPKKDVSRELNESLFCNRKCEGVFSPKSSQSSLKRKYSFSDGSDDSSPARKQLRSLNERVDGTEISLNESTPSPIKLSVSQTSQYQDERFLSSFHLNTPVDNLYVFLSPNVNSPSNRSDLDDTENYYSSPKHFYSSTISCKKIDNEQKMLDDSFSFNVNDSVLLKDIQTPMLKSKQVTPVRSAQFRTPLDSIKSTSPVTPLPDYDGMSNEEFEAELIKFGLKKNLSRSKGIKMLRHIYEKLHPLVEVISLDGKELLVPLGDKTPVAKSTHLPSCAPKPIDVNKHDDDQSDNEPLSQQSTGSSGGEDMPEETILEEDDDLSQGVTSRDLKQYIHTWITSQPHIHEMILSYEPIWLDSFHDEIKSKFKANIKINQLMDILDEEGITFRVPQGQRNVRRNKRSPKKKHFKAKTKRASPKVTQASSPKKQITQTSTSSS